MEVHNALEEILKDAELDEYLRNRLDSRYIAMAACAVGNEVYRSNMKLSQKMKVARYIMNDKKLKEVLNRAKQYNIETLRNLKDLKDLRGKEEAERERTVIRNLIFYTGLRQTNTSKKQENNKG